MTKDNQGWQPIETAPKDGTHILIFCPHDDVPIAVGHMWAGEGPAFWSYADELLMNVCPEGCDPTHWMPLPPPPEQSDG